jgi:colanic acid/amylovoran biosynthesis glycosyltransferase
MNLHAKIRLAYLVSRYPAANHTFILREVRGLRARGFDVRVASVSAPDRESAALTDVEREEMNAAFYVKKQGVFGALRANARSFLRRPAAYLKGFFFALTLNGLNLSKLPATLFYFIEAVTFGDWMRRENLTHFHTHFSSTVGLLARQTFPFTMSATIHGPAEFDDVRGFHLAKKVAASEFVCAISNFCRSQIMRACAPTNWNKIIVAPLGVDTKVFAPEVLRRNLPEKRDDIFEVVCVGRLAPVKAQLVLIRALKIILDQGRAARLRLVGDGEDRQMLKREVEKLGIAEHVFFEGWRNQDEIIALYARADLCALASFAEGVPVVLMEAMALGLPCAATFVNGIPELIRHERDGLLVPPSDESALARAIRRLMDDAELRRNLAESARRRVVENYDLDKNTAKLAEIFKRHLAAANAAHAEKIPARNENGKVFVGNQTGEIFKSMPVENPNAAVSRNE